MSDIEPLISVIITTCQRPHVVDNAIRSVLRQTYLNRELIVVVDGPDPETLRYLKGFATTELKVLELASNVGPSESRNEGVRIAEGDWIAFCDDDDEWFPLKLESQIAAVTHAGPGTNFVHSRFEQHSPIEVRVRPESFPKTGEHLSDYFYNRAGLLIPTVFMVRRATLLLLPFTTNLRRHVDVDWMLRAEAAGLFMPCWSNDVVAIYHTEAQHHRVSTQVDWTGRYHWLCSNLPLLTKESIPYYIAMFCIPEAKRSQRRLSAFVFLIREAHRLGRLTPRSACYILIMMTTEANTRARLRQWLPILGTSRGRLST